MHLAFLPAAENTRSTPAEEAGAAKYCLPILARCGAHFISLAFHQALDLEVRLLVLCQVPPARRTISPVFLNCFVIASGTRVTFARL